MGRLPWYEWQNLRQRLVVFGRAVQGAAPYRVLIEPDPAKCPTGYCNFTRRTIAVNPAVFPDVRPRTAYALTKALLAHEAGHRRFTIPIRLPALVHLVANILEDERIERLMAEEFAGVRPLLALLTQQMYAESPDLEPNADRGQVLAAALQHRWATALGQPLKGHLSGANQRRWGRVRPLVEAAWEAPDTVEVVRLAREIVGILCLRDDEVPRWVRDLQAKLGELVGERERGDGAERGVSSKRNAAGLAASPSDPEPFDGEVPPDDHPAGSGPLAIPPKPYRNLEEQACPLAHALIEELGILPIPDLSTRSERGGRLSLRQLVRDPRHPFLLPQDERPAPPSLALRLVVDHSTSMNVVTSSGKTRIASVAVAAMALHVACAELGISHAITATPQQVVLADSSSGERGKALLAGLVPALADWEDVAKAIEIHRRALEAESTGRKVLVVLHDGYPNDAERARRLCAERSTVEILGVLLDPDPPTHTAMAGIFGERLIACPSGGLPARLGAVLRNLGKP